MTNIETNQQQEAILGGILHIAMATNVMFTGLLAALRLLLWHALQAVLRHFPPNGAFHQRTSLGTAFLPGHTHLIHFQVIHGPSFTTGHQRAARFATDLVRVAHPSGSVLRGAPQDATLVEFTGLST